MTFTISIAGVVAEIVCEYERNRLFLKNYCTDKTAFFRVEPAEEDLRFAKRQIREQALREGRDAATIEAWFAENTAIHGLLANALIDYNVLLVHGSAVVLDGEAYIFLADSGTGQSTHWPPFA